MSKRTPIFTKGRTGQGSFSPSVEALSNRNQTQLLEILNAATPIIEEIAKVKPETWNSMRGIFSGAEHMFGSVAGGALTPSNMFRNRFMNIFQGALAPLQVGLNNLSNQVESFVLQNQGGATVGGIAGGIIGAFIGHPALGAIFGSMLGAYLQQFTETEGFKDAEGNSFQLIPDYNEPFAGSILDPIFQTSAAEQAIVPYRSPLSSLSNNQQFLSRSLISRRGR